MRNLSKKYSKENFVDIFLESKDEKFIIDTKYKINEGKFGEFSNSDIFQMITYERIHHSQNAILIYSTIEKNKELMHKYELCEGANYKEGYHNHYITTATIYLGDDLQTEKQNLIERLSTILKETIN